MVCIKCHETIPESALYCPVCGKKQGISGRSHQQKRAHGTGTVSIDDRYRNRYIAHAPVGADGRTRKYLGAFPDAESADKAIIDYIRRGSPDLYNATVNDVYEKWSETHFTRISEKSADSYRSVWKHFAPIAGMKMSSVKAVHLQSIVNSHSGNGVARCIKALANYLCKFAMENDIIDKNYAEFVKLPKSEKTEKTIFTAKQITELWRYSGDRNVQAILVMIYMGFRIGEITALTADDVHLEEGYITGGVKTNAGKNRIVPFPPNIPEIKGFVEKWLSDRGADGRLFPMTEHTFRSKVFYATLIKLGLLDAHIDRKRAVIFHTEHHLTPHSTRHTFATLSAAAGMQPERLQKIIGHASYHTTADYYVHTDRDALTSEMSKLFR